MLNTPYSLTHKAFSSFGPKGRIPDNEFLSTFEQDEEKHLTANQEKTFNCSDSGNDHKFYFSISLKGQLQSIAVRKDPFDLLLACYQKTAHVSCDGIVFQDMLLI